MNEKIDFLAKAKSYEKEALESLRGLLRIPSVYDEKTVSEKTPFGQAIEDALCYMLDLARKDGFKTEKDGGYAGHIEYGEGDEVIGVAPSNTARRLPLIFCAPCAPPAAPESESTGVGP